MAIRLRPRRPPEAAEIILIPMIDTMLFLLTFFIIASLALAVQNGPPAAPPPTQNVTLTINAAGSLHLNAKPTTLAQETADLKALGVSAGTLFIINADAAVKHGIVTDAMDNARKAGIARFAIATAS